MNVLLDTCTLIWLASEPKRLSTRVSAYLNQPAAVWQLSHASIWEIHLKWKSGKLRLPSPPRTWIDHQLAYWQIEAVSIDLETLHRTSELPDHHTDPFDRIIVAQALIHQWVIATPDSWIQKYPIETVW